MTDQEYYLNMSGKTKKEGGREGGREKRRKTERKEGKKYLNLPFTIKSTVEFTVLAVLLKEQVNDPELEYCKLHNWRKEIRNSL